MLDTLAIGEWQNGQTYVQNLAGAQNAESIWGSAA